MTKEEFKIKILPLSNRIYRIALRFLNDKQEAEDATQDVLIKLWDKRKKLKQYKSIEAFSTVITKNYCLDKLKARRMEFKELENNSLMVDTKTPDKKAEDYESYNVINSIINTLPDQQKIIMQLRDIEQCSYEEIEKVTTMSVNTIRVALSRARKKVKEELIKKYNYGLAKN